MVAYVGESWLKRDAQAKQGNGDNFAGSADTCQKLINSVCRLGFSV
jgi:hypothetical protein